jgi:hypothetical protein
MRQNEDNIRDGHCGQNGHSGRNPALNSKIQTRRSMTYFYAEKMAKTAHFNENLRVQICALYGFFNVKMGASFALNCVSI